MNILNDKCEFQQIGQNKDWIPISPGSTPCSTRRWWRRWTSRPRRTSATLWAMEPRPHPPPALDMHHTHPQTATIWVSTPFSNTNKIGIYVRIRMLPPVNNIQNRQGILDVLRSWECGGGDSHLMLMFVSSYINLLNLLLFFPGAGGGFWINYFNFF